VRIPRDREGTFDPKLIQRYQRRFPGFDDKIVSIYARGMSVREIQGHLAELYGIDVSRPDLDGHRRCSGNGLRMAEPAARGELSAGLLRCSPGQDPGRGAGPQQGGLIALGVAADGTKDVLGLRIENTEGAKFWLKVMNELRNRGVGDILIAVVDGLKGFPEAIEAVFPRTIVQTCIVHLIRHSLEFVSWADRKPVVPQLRDLLRGRDADAGLAALEAFAAGPWGRKYPALAPAWRPNWDKVIPFFAFPAAVRRIVYTTNAIEALNAKLRRAVKIRGHFPTDEAATKLIYLVLHQAAANGKRRQGNEARQKLSSRSCSRTGSSCRNGL
jgi:putative transposase